MDDLTRNNAQKCKSVFDDVINKNDKWTCHAKEKPMPNKACYVLIFEIEPFIGLDYQLLIASYDPIDYTYTDVINGLKMHVDSPVCTYWKYVEEE